MTTTPVKEHLFHVLSSGLHGMLLAGSTDFIYFFLDFLIFFYKEPVLNVPEYFLICPAHDSLGRHTNKCPTLFTPDNLSDIWGLAFQYQ